MIGTGKEVKIIAIDKKGIRTYEIDPAYLITGVSGNIKDFNLEYYVENSSKEQRDDFLTVCWRIYPN